MSALERKEEDVHALKGIIKADPSLAKPILDLLKAAGKDVNRLKRLTAGALEIASAAAPARQEKPLAVVSPVVTLTKDEKTVIEALYPKSLEKRAKTSFAAKALTTDKATIKETERSVLEKLIKLDESEIKRIFGKESLAKINFEALVRSLDDLSKKYD